MGCGSSTGIHPVSSTGIHHVQKDYNENQIRKPSLTSQLPPNDESSSLRSSNESSITPRVASRVSSRVTSGVTPRVSPPTLKKNDVIPDPSMFAAIDKHALEAPNRLRASIEDLAAYLVKPARNDLEKIRAFYRWITNNIRYDVESYFSGKYKSCDPKSVLRDGNAICQGYADLFYNLCKLAHIPCHVVSGFSKGFGYNPEIPFTVTSETDHAWNIVFVKGEWRPVECTWGAGHLNINGQFEKEYQEYYFLTDPETFIHAHFPFMNGDEIASELFQLLDKPLRLNEFNISVNPSSYSSEWGVELLSHKKNTITVNEEVDILLQGNDPLLQDITSEFYQKTSRKPYNNFTMIKPEGNGKFRIRIRPPASGKYQFEIFGKIDAEEHTCMSLVNYIIICSKTCPQRPYPEHTGAWGAKAKAAEFGFHPDLFSYSTFTCNNGEFEMSLDITQQMSVSCKLQFSDETATLGRYIVLSCQPDSIHIKAKFLQVGFHVIQLFAGKPESSSLEFVASFLVDNKSAARDPAPFPYYYRAAHDHHCVILQPVSGDLAVNNTTLLRCVAPSMKRLMVGGDIYTKKNGDIFEVSMLPKSKGEFIVYGSTMETGTLNGLFRFQVV